MAENQNSPPDAGTIQLVSVLGVPPVTEEVVINERTTVASGFAMAQFTTASGIGGTSPGLQNAAGMVANIADAMTGDVSDVLGTAPNGGETTAVDTFNSLANMVTACIETPADCAALFTAATPPGGTEPTDTFTAMGDIARNPGRDAANVAALFAVSELGSTPYQPARSVPPAAWFLALRFDGDGNTLNGPGNFASTTRGTSGSPTTTSTPPTRRHPCAAATSS